jgi:hypothetical protein
LDLKTTAPRPGSSITVSPSMTPGRPGGGGLGAGGGTTSVQPPSGRVFNVALRTRAWKAGSSSTSIARLRRLGPKRTA